MTISVTRKGSMPRTSLVILMLPTPQTTYSTVPTGGVMTPMPRFRMNSRPKKYGSMPAWVIRG